MTDYMEGDSLNLNGAPVPITARSLMDLTGDQADAVLALGKQVYEPARRYHALVEMIGIRRGVTRMLVDNWEHCLQAATRASCAGADEETIVVTLFHDAFDHVEFGIQDHGAMIAEVMLPYVSDENAWLLKLHVECLWHFRPYLPASKRNACDKYRGHPAFEKTMRFCEQYDAVSFDPRYPSQSIATFEPMAQRVLARPPNVRKLW